MGLWKSIKKVLGYAFDFRVDRWVDYPFLKKSTHFYLQQYKTLFKPVRKEVELDEFEEAVEKLALSPKELSEQSQRYFILSILFLMMSVTLLIYAALLFSFGNWMGGTITCSLAFYALSLGFRFHFWYFQISKQKLGCSFREWLQFLLKNPKKAGRV